jgi:predicted dehydrogenase
MAVLADLHRAVTATLADKRIGQPVFVRCIIYAKCDSTSPEKQLEPINARLQDWFGHYFECHHATIDEETGQASYCLTTPHGALGLVSFASTRAVVETVDLTLLGTHGAIYHAAELPPLMDEVPAPSPPRVATGRARPYGVLLVSGCHTHQEEYALAFAADSRCRILAVTDESHVDAQRRELNERLVVSLGVPYVPDLDEALRDPAIDIVSICAPPDRRGRIAVRCAEAGKELYLDKSLSPKLEESRAIVAAVRKAGVRSHMFSFITSNWARQAKRVLESGVLGKLLAIHAETFFAKGHAGTVKRPTVRREEYPPERHQLIAAKRELDNIGVYPITLVCWLTGRAFASVRAFTANFFFVEHERYDVEDFGMLAGALEDGLPVTIAAGRIGWSSHPSGGVNRLILVGSEHSVIIDANRPRLEICANEPPWMPPPAHPDDPMAFWTSTQLESGIQRKRTWVPLEPPINDVSYFLDLLDTDSDSEMSAGEAALATEVLLAAYKSAASGTVVCLPLDER